MLHHLGPNVVAFSTERCIDDGFDQPYAGFNASFYCGDDAEHTATCFDRLCKFLGTVPARVVMPHQIHGTRIAEVTEDTLCHPELQLEGVDGLITHLPETCLCISTADCVPLLLYDKRTQAVAAVHAGWRGTVNRIGVKALAAMHDAYGTLPADVTAIIGPSIGPDAFEVGDEVYDLFQQAGFPMAQIAFRQLREREDHPAARWHINLWEANTWQLTCAGIPAVGITTTGICTYSHYQRFFSARRLGINSGRILTGIMRR